MDDHGALNILSEVVNICIENGYLNGTDLEDVSFEEVFSKLQSSLGLLDDFKLWYSLDPITKLRGKNKLNYLADYYKQIHANDKEDDN